MGLRLGVFVGVLLSVLGTVPEVRGQGADSPTATLSSDELACGSLAGLKEQVQARSRRIRFVDSGALHQVRIRIQRVRGAGVSAEIRFGSGATEHTRELSANDCEELISAVGFVIAMEIDPPEKSTPAPPPEEKEREAPAQQASPPQDLKLDEIVDRPAPLPPRKRPSYRWRMGAGGVIETGPAPSALKGGTLRLAWTPSAPFQLPGTSRFGLDLGYSRSGSVAAEGGTADFQLSALGLVGCPLSLAVGPLELWPCAHFEAGTVISSGRETLEPRTEWRPWLTTGGMLELELNLSRSLHLGLQGAWSRAWVRDRFQFDPNRFYHVPAGVSRFGAQLVYAF